MPITVRLVPAVRGTLSIKIELSTGVSMDTARVCVLGANTPAKSPAVAAAPARTSDDAARLHPTLVDELQVLASLEVGSNLVFAVKKPPELPLTKRPAIVTLPVPVMGPFVLRVELGWTESKENTRDRDPEISFTEDDSPRRDVGERGYLHWAAD